MSESSKSIDSSSRYKVVVCRNLGPDVMAILETRKELDLVVWPYGEACDRKWLLENIPGSSGLLVMLSDKVDNELLERAGDELKVVSTMSVGYEHVDIQALAKRQLKLGYTPDVLTDAVADLAVMLALMASRNAKYTMSIVERGEWTNYPWSPYGFVGPQLSTTEVSSSRTVGFLGFGRIAQATLARLIPFGIAHCIFTGNPSSPIKEEVLTSIKDKHGLQSIRSVDLDQLAEESDLLFVLAPGGATTKHIINEHFLRRMKKTSVLINPSRGTLVNSHDLAKALREGWIWGAGLDVVEGEPHIPIDHPLVKEPRCVIVPHIGSATIETRLGMATLAARNVLAGVLGEQLPVGLELSRFTQPTSPQEFKHNL